MRDDRIDFSTVDPSNDQERWDGLLDSVSQRAYAARSAREHVPGMVAGWSRVALALAAGLALIVWVVVSFKPSPAPQLPQKGQSGLSAFSMWIEEGTAESVWDQLARLEVDS